MEALAQEFPQYGWERNAGYGTHEHQAALASYGITPHHRRSFAPIRKLLEMAA
jgi:ribonuclease HII